MAVEVETQDYPVSVEAELVVLVVLVDLADLGNLLPVPSYHVDRNTHAIPLANAGSLLLPGLQVQALSSRHGCGTWKDGCASLEFPGVNEALPWG